MLMTRIMGTLRNLDRAPEGFYIERQRGYDGPFRDEAAARAALGPIDPDKPRPGSIIYWTGRPSGP